MPSLCNSTLSSSPDSDDYQYWSSFCEKPFCCGDRLQVYKGKLNGKGPRGGDFSVVKIFLDQPGTEARCYVELNKAQTVSQLITRFISRGQYRPDRLHVAELQMAPMDQVSCLTKLLAPHRRRPNSGEWILIEEMFQARGSNLVQFVDKHGFTQRERAASGSAIGFSRENRRSGSWHGTHRSGFNGSNNNSGQGAHCSVSSRELVDALVHFSHQASGGELVVCGLEGVEDDSGRVLLKTPVIHSNDKRFGETDLGERGVREVMGRHVCNRHCRRVLRMSHYASAPGVLSAPPAPFSYDSSSTTSSSSSSSSLSSVPARERSPSAPQDPDILSHHVIVRRHYSEPSAPPFEGSELDLDAPRLPLEVFHLAGCEAQAGGMMLYLHFQRRKDIPEEPPPPYTEHNEP